MALWMSSMVASCRRKRDCCARAGPTDKSDAASRKNALLELNMVLRNFRRFRFLDEDGIQIFVRIVAAQQHLAAESSHRQSGCIDQPMGPHLGITLEVRD